MVSYKKRLQFASGWFLTKELPDDWWESNEVKSEEEVDKWLEDRLKEDYRDWSGDYVWDNIEYLASYLKALPFSWHQMNKEKEK